MKLDRNNNPTGKGKYALLNMRTNKVEYGDECQFFVIKYKDQFAEAALRAYAHAVRAEAAGLQDNADNYWDNAECDEAIAERAKAASLREYATEIDGEADLARHWPTKKIPD